MIKVHIDFETRSTVDLPKAGVHAYCESPTTDVWCMAYAVDEGEVKVWTPADGNLPDELLELIGREDVRWYGHNVNFEWHLWNMICVPKYGWPELAIEHCYCTAAMSRAMALPGDLAGAALACHLDVKKDDAGKRLMLRMCRPRRIEPDGTIIWWDQEDKLDRLIEYCKVDVLVERNLAHVLMDLTASERRVWLADHRINGRGVYIDDEAVNMALAMVMGAKAKLNDEIYDITKGKVTAGSNVTQIIDWLASRGVEVESLEKESLPPLIRAKETPKDVRRVLRIRQEVGKSSTSKLNAILRGMSSDGRVREIHLYHGASTGRWAGRRIQPQNFPRTKVKDEEAELMVDAIIRGDSPILELLYGGTMNAISLGLRSMLRAAPGKKLITADFSAIEARGIAWLAGQEDTLAIFRDHGMIYEHTASQIYGIPISEVDEDKRFVGKTAVLALGYQGGKAAFALMAANLGVDVNEDFAEEIKVAWRKKNTKIVNFWYALEEAAECAIRNPGTGYSVSGGKIMYRKVGPHLFCRLPSGRVITYPYAKVEMQETKVGMKDVITFWGQNTKTRKWGRQQTYGGKLAENVTQAVCRDILAFALLNCEAAGYLPVMDVHDEIVAEVDEDFGSVKEMEAIMSKVPEWAEGFPIAAEGWEGIRYRK